MKQLLACALAVTLAVATGCGSEDKPQRGRYDPGPITTAPPPGLPTSPPPAAAVGTPTSPLEELQFGAVGRWQGTASLADNPSRAWELWLDLHADGRYSAGCIDARCRAAFNEGNDGDHPSKTYWLYDLEGERGMGEIFLLHGGDGKGMATTFRATLRDVRLSRDRETFTFTFARPAMAVVRYELRRVR